MFAAEHANIINLFPIVNDCLANFNVNSIPSYKYRIHRCTFVNTSYRYIVQLILFYVLSSLTTSLSNKENVQLEPRLF